MRVASRGRVVVKLKAKMPTTAMASSGSRSSRVDHDVAEAFADLSLGPGHDRALVELGGTHHEQGDQDGHVGRGVEEEAGRQADGEDEDASDGRADHPGGVHDHAVEADGVGHEITADHLGDEGLAGRVVEEVDHAEERGDQVDLPHRDGPQRHEEPEDEGEHARGRLGDVEEPSLVDPVDDQPAPAAEQQHRHELQSRDEADVEAVPVELVREDQQAQGDRRASRCPRPRSPGR